MIEYREPVLRRLKRRFGLLRGLVDGETANTGPFWADLDITCRCNLRCLGCLYHSPLVTGSNETNLGVRDMPVELARRAVRQLAAMGTHTIIIQGAGEPLLHPGLIDIIAAVKREGLFCRLLTNGTLLDRSMVEKLIGAGLDSLRISIWANAPGEMQGSDSGNDIDNFNKILRGLELLDETRTRLKSSLPKVELYQAVTQNNYQSQAGLVDLAKKHKCSGVHFAHLITRRGQLDQFALSPDMEKACVRNLTKLRTSMEAQGIRHNLNRLNLRYNLGERVWEHAACFTPWFRLRVLVDGTVKICRGHDEVFGHLNETSLDDIWNGPLLKAFRRRVSTREGLARVAEQSDCRACCFFCENLRVEHVYRWFRPFVAKPGSKVR